MLSYMVESFSGNNIIWVYESSFTFSHICGKLHLILVPITIYNIELDCGDIILIQVLLVLNWGDMYSILSIFIK